MGSSQKFSLTDKQDEAMDCLITEAKHNALGGGSRSGKTFLLILALISRALKAAGSRHAVFRYRFNSVKASVVLDTLPKVMKLCYPGLWEQSKLDKTDWYLTLPNGSEIWFGGLDDKDRTEKILGMEFATIYFNECSQIPYNSYITAKTRLAQKCGLRLKFYFDFNPPSKRHWTYRTFVENVDAVTGSGFDNPEDYTYFLLNPEDNQANLATEYLEILNNLPEKARNRFLLGKFSDDDDNALWTDSVLAKCRLLGRVTDVIPEFMRIVVAVDPSGCRGDEDTRSDEVGIAVCALGIDGHGYLLEDLSGRYSPTQWGRIASDAYDRHKADRVVAEINYGGAMVESTIRAANPNIAYSEVRASRGKTVRAEPISALYELGKIHHIGYFPELEEQLTAMTTSGYMGVKSPDRADAMIWGFTELFPRMTKRDNKNKNRDVTIPPAYSAFA